MKNFFRSILFSFAIFLSATAARADAPEYVDDDATLARLQKQLEKLNAATNKVSLSDLQAQLDRTGTVARLARTSSRERSWSEIYSRVKSGVFIVGELYKCTKCHHWHVSGASGFVITRDGALVTNYHVVKEGAGVVMGAMSSDGRFFPVKAVLAASRREDIAIVQLDGADFEPLPLLADKPVGAPVAVLSHPNLAFYSLTDGIVSRYSFEPVSGHSKSKRHSLVITADYAKGSSGSPVFDACGNVVGLASSTESVYYDEDHGKQENLQQVFKFCVPAACVLDLLHAP